MVSITQFTAFIRRLIIVSVWIVSICLIGSTSSSSSSPQVWQRPGCHKIGHIRTISVDGCLKFNVSTNACRGQCLSYSVPAGAESDPHLMVTDEAAPTISSMSALSQTGSEVVSPVSNAQQVLIEQQQQEGAEILQNSVSNTYPLGGGVGGGSGTGGHNNNNVNNNNLNSVGEPASRDVVSIGQCCNMMDSEELKINVKCRTEDGKGYEIREFKFQTAKTCECFFCNHL